MEIACSIPHVFAHVAWNFHAVFHTESHGLSMENFTHEMLHGIPWSIKPGPLSCTVAKDLFYKLQYHHKWRQTYQWQATAWNIGKVVMLIVVSNIECDVIQWPIVRISLVSLLKHVVFRDKVSCNWMKSHCQRSSTDQIDKRSPAHCPVDDYIKYQLQHNYKLGQTNPLKLWSQIHY